MALSPEMQARLDKIIEQKKKAEALVLKKTSIKQLQRVSKIKTHNKQFGGQKLSSYGTSSAPYVGEIVDRKAYRSIETMQRLEDMETLSGNIFDKIYLVSLGARFLHEQYHAAGAQAKSGSELLNETMNKLELSLDLKPNLDEVVMKEVLVQDQDDDNFEDVINEDLSVYDQILSSGDKFEEVLESDI